MNDDAVADLVGPYVDDDLPAELKRRVEEALLTSPQLAWEIATQRLIKEKLKSDAGEVMASDAFRTRLLKKLYTDNPHCRQPEEVEAEGQIALPIGF